MSDLYKYLFGTLAGVLICLLCFIGYFFILDNMAPPDPAGHQKVIIDSSKLQFSRDSADMDEIPSPSDLTPEQEARLFSARTANEGLTKRYSEYSENDNANIQNTIGGPDLESLGLNNPSMLQDDNNKGSDDSNSETERQLNLVREMLTQGKHSAQKNQLDTAIAAFEQAIAALPDNKKAAADSYLEMAKSLFLMSKTAPDEKTAEEARRKAEEYVKNALESDNTAEARILYGKIIEEQRLADNRKKLLFAQKDTDSERQKKQVVDFIAQGKNAAKKKQMDNAVRSFEQADNIMPKDERFRSSSYIEMADSLLSLSEQMLDLKKADELLDNSEKYVKKAIDLRETASGNELYTKILNARKKIEAERQRTIAQQRAAGEQQLADARKKAETERQQAAAQKKAEAEKQTQNLITQGKSAAQKNQLNEAIQLFKQADTAMPDDKAFASNAYTDMAETLLNTAIRSKDADTADNALADAQVYNKKSLSSQNSAAVRTREGKIADARKKLENEKRQADARKKAEEDKKLLEQQKKQVKSYLAQGKNASKKKLLSDADKVFTQADAVMPNDKAFASGTYMEMADAFFTAARQMKEPQEKIAALDYAEKYIKKAVESRNTSAVRSLQGKIAAERKKAETAVKTVAEQKKQTNAAPKSEKETAETAGQKKKREAAQKHLSQGKQAAQRKQLKNTLNAFTQAEKNMPNDSSFVSESYRTMAESLLNFAKSTQDKKAAQEALKKADEYIKKSLAAKDSADARALQKKIADMQKTAADGNKQSASNTAPLQNTPQSRAEVEALMAQGRAAAESGSFSDAQAAFERASAMMPAADSSFSARKYREMAQVMHSLSKRSPAHKNTALKSSEKAIRKSINAKNDESESRYVYSEIADDLNNAALALSELEAAQRLAPDNYRYNYELGRRYYELQQYQKAKGAFESAVKANPRSETALFNLGMTHKVLNTNKAAIDAFKKAAALKPDYIRAWVELARIYDKTKNYAESLKNYEKALSLEARNPIAVKEMAQVYAKQKNIKQAEHYFKESLALGDTDPITYYNLASVQLELGNIKEGLVNAEMAVNANNQDARFLYTYGLALEKNKRDKDAETFYKKAIAADPKYGKPRINIGRMYLEAKNFRSAEEHLKAAYAVEPSNFELNTNLGKLYGLKNQFGESIDYYTHAIKLMPKDIDARQNLAAAYLSAGLKENARDTYKAILQIDSRAWDSYYELGKLSISLNNSDEAKALFQKLLKQKPNYRHAAEVKRLLSSL